MTVINMECRTGMMTLPENSIDAIVTDPPYGLSKEPDMAEVLRHWLAGDDYDHGGGGFMGKSWDSFVPGPATWREALRVLKPGGHALIFAGSRTQDLMTTSLRLAGFEIRDTAMWLYGSGFPKSLNVSKAVEKAHGTGAGKERALKFTAWMRSTGIKAIQIDKITDSQMGSHYLSNNSQPAIATFDMFQKIKHLLPEPPADIIELIRWKTIEIENINRRKKVGKVTKARSTSGNSALPTIGGDTLYKTWDVTSAHTDQAKDWEGYGTALKPAYEPIIIARKPLGDTVAATVLKHGTGAINIDGCRVPTNDTLHAGSGGLLSHQRDGKKYPSGQSDISQGRWPANILHDGLTEEWARYFYCAKTSKADRNAGCDHLDHVSAGETTGGRAEGSAGLDSPRSGAGRTSGAKNYHPTVKPTDLMRWCCRLVGHPGAMILDPFAGSGSTGRGAVLEGFEFIGFQWDPEDPEGHMVDIANARINNAYNVRNY